jgi:hypothetical protein
MYRIISVVVCSVVLAAAGIVAPMAQADELAISSAGGEIAAPVGLQPGAFDLVQAVTSDVVPGVGREPEDATNPFAGCYTGFVPGSGGSSWKIKVSQTGGMTGRYNWKDGQYWSRGSLSGSVTDDGTMVGSVTQSGCYWYGCEEGSYSFTAIVALNDAGDSLLLDVGSEYPIVWVKRFSCAG